MVASRVRSYVKLLYKSSAKAEQGVTSTEHTVQVREFPICKV
jgi:hypothetical protein